MNQLDETDQLAFKIGGDEIAAFHIGRVLALDRLEIFSVMPERVPCRTGDSLQILWMPRASSSSNGTTFTSTPRLAARRVFLRDSCGSLSHHASNVVTGTAA